MEIQKDRDLLSSNDMFEIAVRHLTILSVTGSNLLKLWSPPLNGHRWYASVDTSIILLKLWTTKDTLPRKQDNNWRNVESRSDHWRNTGMKLFLRYKRRTVLKMCEWRLSSLRTETIKLRDVSMKLWQKSACIVTWETDIFFLFFSSALNRLTAKHDRVCAELQNEEDIEVKLCAILESAEWVIKTK